MTLEFLILPKERATRGNTVKDSVDLRKLAKNALQPIEKKLKGMYTKEANRKDRRDKEISTSNLVQMLIEESTDKRNLVSSLRNVSHSYD